MISNNFVNEVVMLIAFASLFISVSWLAQEAEIKASTAEGATLCTMGAFIIRRASDSFVLLMIMIMALSMFIIKLRDKAIAKSLSPIRVGLWLIAIIGVAIGAFPVGLKPAAIINMAALALAILATIASNRIVAGAKMATHVLRPSSAPSRAKAKPKKQGRRPVATPAKPTTTSQKGDAGKATVSSPEKDKEKATEPWLVILAITLVALILMVVGWGLMELSLYLPRP